MNYDIDNIILSVIIQSIILRYVEHVQDLVNYIFVTIQIVGKDMILLCT